MQNTVGLRACSKFGLVELIDLPAIESAINLTTDTELTLKPTLKPTSIHHSRRLRYATFASLWLCGALDSIAALPEGRGFTNSVGMAFVRIESGRFVRGNDAKLPEEILKARGQTRAPQHGDYDERPTHPVTISKPFYLGIHEVTNEQYEQFDRRHAYLRGKNGFSIDHNEAVIFVSWDEAKAYCDWLSQKEGLPYRLPTEAEWEYACRAGTTTPFSTGDTLPAEFLKNPGNSWYPAPSASRGRTEVVPLHVGRTPANPWGLFDMHGNVEEWCEDWYGPYLPGEQTDPRGRSDGDFKVSRGGSHSTTAYYLRSANRQGSPPESRSWYIGFRVALGEMPNTPQPPPVGPAFYQQNVRQSAPRAATQKIDSRKPYFKGPLIYVKIPPGSEGPLFSQHNHDPDIAPCPNGDLLAVWYTTVEEPGRELAVAISRLPYGSDEWQAASSFWDVPDRNDHCPMLWFDGKKTLYHFNGLSAAATWGPLAITMRSSTDNGVSWSKARMIVPEYHARHQLISSEFRSREGWMILPCDASTEGHGGSALQISQDGGQTWFDPGGTIAGIHAGVTQLKDGRLLAFGRGDNIDDRMPQSVSADMGKTWTYSASQWPTIGSGQRLVLMRLNEGPLLFVSFTDNAKNLGAPRGLPFQDAAGKEFTGYGIFAALSFDEGQTWSVRKLLTAGATPRQFDGGAWTRGFTMDATHAEPRGYLAATQTRDGIIHLISSALHYQFNVAWLKVPPESTNASHP